MGDFAGRSNKDNNESGLAYLGISLPTRVAIKNLDEGKEGQTEKETSASSQGVRPWTKSTPAQDAQLRALIAKRGGR